ncbi:MAG: inhibitor of KinA [Saprospiraceae bacterium]|jgi:inhibitor of KinA
MKATVDFLSEDTLIVRFDSRASEALSAQIQRLVVSLRERCGSSIVECVPSYTSVLIQFDLFSLSHESLQRQIEQAFLEESHDSTEERAAKLVQIPVCYAPEFALDIDEMAQQRNCGTDEIMQLHSETSYTVYAIGFCPGFAFLGNVPDAIATARKATPRAIVPAGSVGIANQQTAVYPTDSPGGWNIIGRSPMQIVDYNLPALCPFQIGDQIKFSAISVEEYYFLKGSEQ